MHSTILPRGGARHAHASERPASESHLIFFYEDEEFLVDVVIEFLCAGRSTPAQTLILASEQHAALLVAALERRGLDLPAALQSGALVVIDAHALLKRVAEGGQLRADRLIAALDAMLLESLRDEGSVRAYGELAGILHEQGLVEQCQQLEEHWARIVHERPVSLLCGYRGGRTSVLSACSIAQLCSRHSVTLPSEHCSSLGRVEARLQHLFLLERRLQAMDVALEQSQRHQQRLQRDVDMLNTRLAAAGELLHDVLVSSQAELTILGSSELGRSEGQSRFLSRVVQYNDVITSVMEILGHPHSTHYTGT